MTPSYRILRVVIMLALALLLLLLVAYGVYTQQRSWVIGGGSLTLALLMPIQGRDGHA